MEKSVHKNNLSHSEAGVALVAVLALLSSVSLLVLSMVAYSQLSSYGIGSDVSVQRSRYVAEGAMNRIIYLAAADRQVYERQDIASIDHSEFDEVRLIPDGRQRELDYYGVKVKYMIENGMGGLFAEQDLPGTLEQLMGKRAQDDSDLSEAMDQFIDRYGDYVDSDDMTNLEGMESEDYQEIEEDSPLPRNGNLNYREELWFIPEGIKFFPPDRFGRMTLINPLGMVGNPRNIKPDLLQANYSLLTNYSNLSHDDAVETLQNVAEYKKSETPEVLSESFDPLLWDTLSRYYSTSDSTGCYRITIINAAGDGFASSRMDATLFVPESEQNGQSIVFYDWLIY